MNYRIRPATRADIDAMYEVSCLAHQTDTYINLIPPRHIDRFRNNYSGSELRRQKFTDDIAGFIAQPAGHVLVAVSSTTVLGYVFVLEESPTWFRCKSLFVRPDSQHGGVGSALLEAVLHGLRPGARIVLDVLEGNSAAIRLYERHGFRVTRQLPLHYYGVPLIEMARPFPAAE